MGSPDARATLGLDNRISTDILPRTPAPIEDIMSVVKVLPLVSAAVPGARVGRHGPGFDRRRDAGRAGGARLAADDRRRQRLGPARSPGPRCQRAPAARRHDRVQERRPRAGAGGRGRPGARGLGGRRAADRYGDRAGDQAVHRAPLGARRAGARAERPDRGRAVAAGAAPARAARRPGCSPRRAMRATTRSPGPARRRPSRG